MDNILTKELFFKMLRIRSVELMIADLYSEEEMRCPVHLSIGQEATAVGICKNLKKTDQKIIFFRPQHCALCPTVTSIIITVPRRI